MSTATPEGTPPATPSAQTGPSEAEAKKAQKAAAKAQKEADKVAKAAAKSTQNGVSRPAAGTKTGKVWEIADTLSAQLKRPPERKLVMEQAKAAGINDATCATQFGRWRKFHGLKGPATPPAAPTPVATPAASA